jgi:hypothetical protein
MGPDTTYMVTGQAGGDWYYRVVAYNDAGNSPVSNVEFVTVTMSTLVAADVLPIDNSDMEPRYTVEWSSVSGATSYVLEESNNPYFVDPVVVYSGPLTNNEITNQQSGTWYYRARAISGTDQGPWGTDQSTEVGAYVYLPVIVKELAEPEPSDCTPDPPGDSDNIGDALIICSGQIVTGQVSDSDLDDVYRIEAVNGQHLLITTSGSGGDMDLYLYAPDATDIYGDAPVAYSATTGNDEIISGTVLVSGYWYVNLYSYDGTTNYTVVVTLSDSTTSQTIEFKSTGTGHQRR